MVQTGHTNKPDSDTDNRNIVKIFWQLVSIAMYVTTNWKSNNKQVNLSEFNQLESNNKQATLDPEDIARTMTSTGPTTVFCSEKHRCALSMAAVTGEVSGNSKHAIWPSIWQQARNNTQPENHFKILPSKLESTIWKINYISRRQHRLQNPDASHHLEQQDLTLWGPSRSSIFCEFLIRNDSTIVHTHKWFCCCLSAPCCSCDPVRFYI